MFFLKTKTGEYPKTDQDIRAEFPQTSFPSSIDASIAADFGYEEFRFTETPLLGKHEKSEEVAPVKNNAGVWIQTWAVVAMNDEEKAQADTEKANQVRAERNGKLMQCDWTQLADAPVDKAAWATYRQALRDITAQPGFPWSVDWPVAP